MALDILSNIPGWSLIIIVVGLTAIYFMMDKFKPEKKTEVLTGLGMLVFVIAMIFPLIWAIEFMNDTNFIPINDQDLFSTYEPMFILLLAVVFGVATIDNVLDKSGGK